MITQSVTYVNDYGFGFEAIVGTSTSDRVELDLNYIAADEAVGDSIGICMTAEAARALANLLHKFADKVDGENNGW